MKVIKKPSSRSGGGGSNNGNSNDNVGGENSSSSSNNINLYQDIPKVEVSLDDFEEFALDRLKVCMTGKHCGVCGGPSSALLVKLSTYFLWCGVNMSQYYCFLL